MPKYIPSLPFEDCYGSVGDVTFYHRDGKCYYRKRSCPEFTGTMLQVDHLSVHLRALEAWRQQPQEVQDMWNALAVGVVSHRPPYDGKSGISGYNMFVSAYHGFARLGREHVPVPQAYEAFPPYAVKGIDSTAVDGEDLLLNLNTFLDPNAQPGRYHLLVRVQLAKPQGGFRPGLLRSYLAEPALVPGEGVVTVAVQDFRKVWEMDLDSYTAHLKCVLLDGKTGYRTSPRKVSFDFTR